MQALLAFFFFAIGLATLAVSGMSVRLRLTAMVVVIAESGYGEERVA